MSHRNHFGHSFLLGSAQTSDSARHHTTVGSYELTENQHILIQRLHGYLARNKRVKTQRHTYRVFDVQIETAQRTAFAVVAYEVLGSGRRYVHPFDDQLIADFVRLD